MFDILAVGDYYAALSEGDPLADLRGEIRELCRERPRRIDRYTQLAMLGSARLAQHTQPRAGCGIYLGSRFASLSNTIDIHRRMVEQGEPPKPVHFINSLSNSAGYFVARNLGLDGRNLFVSRSDASLVAALQLAQLDLLSGVVPQALIGNVDEVVQPVAEHSRRLGVEPQTPLAEGSHWMLLEPSSNATVEQRLGTLDEIHLFADESGLAGWLEQMASQSSYQCHIAISPAQELPACLSDVQRYQPALNYYPALAGGGLINWLQGEGDSAAEALLSISSDDEGRYHVFRVRR